MHLIKLAVGIKNFDQLSERQLKKYKENRECIHVQRLYPRKLILKQGFTSIFWVIKGNIQARQEIKEIVKIEKDNSGPICHLILDKKVVPTEIIPHRAFRGWRYIKEVPKDIRLDSKNSRKLYSILKELCLI